MNELVVSIAIAAVSFLAGWPRVHEAWEKYMTKERSQPPNQPPIKNVLSKVRADNKLRIGVIPFPPLAAYRRLSGKDVAYHGLYVDIFEDIALRTGIKVQFCPAPNDKAFALLNSGTVDAIACLLRTPERIRRADFAVLPHTISLNAVKRADDNRISSISDLRKHNLRVVAVKGEIGSEVITDFGVSPHQLTLLETDSVDDIFHLVENKAADVAVTDGITCVQYLEDRKASDLSFAFNSYPLLLEPCGIMTTQGQADLGSWLRDEFELSFTNEKIHAKHESLLTRFTHVLKCI